MAPSLGPGDLLQVAPCNQESIAVGDVVVFAPGESGIVVAHRVVEAHAQWVRTRGDSNSIPDPLPVPRERILGKIVAANGRDGVRPIHGGLRGRVAASVTIVRLAAARAISRLLHRPYHLLARSRVFRFLLPLLPEVRAVAFQRLDGLELQLFLGEKPIGVLPATRGRWLMRRPFKVILGQRILDDLIRERDRLLT